MKKKYLVSTVVLLGVTSLFGGSGKLLQTESGFYYPVNKVHDGSYLGFGQKNSRYGNKCHLAIDYKVAEGSEVHAISGGVVVRANKSVENYGGDTPAKSGGAVVIKHKDATGKFFYALYGHVKNIKVSVGSYVRAGDVIGVVGPYYSGSSYLPHLHFGINTVSISYAGYTPTSSCRNFRGFKSPEKFMKGHSPWVDSVFDGSGSLVSPSEKCYGCDRDTAKMQTHKIGSTVVFQWLKDSQNCSYVDIVSSSELGDVIIKKKGWNSNVVQDAFRTNLKANEKISLSPVIGNNWTIFSVTTQKPLKKGAYVNAVCRPPSYGFMRGDRHYVANEMPSLTNLNVTGDVDTAKYSKTSRYLTGSGSVITRINNRSGFGVDRDWAKKFNKKDSLSAFQWYASSGCKQLTIQSASHSSYTQVERVSMKGWAEGKWQKVCSSIPCKIEAPRNGYFVIKIETKSNQMTSGTFEAVCN